MGIKHTLIGWGSGLFIERPAKKLTLSDLAANLETDGRRIEQRAAQASDSADNQRRLSHVVGIERWGQRRLQVALGEPLLMDEYDNYRPARDLDWQGLQAEFQATRQETIALAGRLEQAGVEATRVNHNSFGDLSVRGWLYYLGRHADLESKRIK